MNIPTPPTANLQDNAGAIITDIPCRYCAYNLRGLRTNGRCPECGAPIASSTHGDYLEFADPHWLARLCRGAWFLLAGMVICGITVVCLLSVIRWLSSPLYVIAIVFPTTVVVLYGIWLITTPDPAGVGEDAYGSARKLARLAVIAKFAAILLLYVKLTYSLPSLLVVPGTLLSVALELFTIFGTFALLYHLQRLAQRIPNTSLARRAGVLKWIIFICSLVVVADNSVNQLITLAGGIGVPSASASATTQTAPPLAAFPTAGPFARIVETANCSAGLVGCMAWIVVLHLLYRLAIQFNANMLLARARRIPAR